MHNYILPLLKNNKWGLTVSIAARSLPTKLCWALPHHTSFKVSVTPLPEVWKKMLVFTTWFLSDFLNIFIQLCVASAVALWLQCVPREMIGFSPTGQKLLNWLYLRHSLSKRFQSHDSSLHYISFVCVCSWPNLKVTAASEQTTIHKKTKKHVPWTILKITGEWRRAP